MTEKQISEDMQPAQQLEHGPSSPISTSKCDLSPKANSVASSEQSEKNESNVSPIGVMAQDRKSPLHEPFATVYDDKSALKPVIAHSPDDAGKTSLNAHIGTLSCECAYRLVISSP